MGRVAQLCNIVSKPELNDKFVLVQSYVADRSRFVVKTLPSPLTDEGSPSTLAVKLESLMPYQQGRFNDAYPHPMEVYVINYMELWRQLHEGSTGTVLHLGAIQISDTPYFPLKLEHDHRILGGNSIGTLDSSGIPHPETELKSSVHVSAQNEENVLEFEDILFTKHKGIIACTRGKNIIFRRCSFQGVKILVGAGNDPIVADKSGLRVGDSIGTPNVVFENCLFEYKNTDEQSYGVYVGYDGVVSLLNCVIRNFVWGVRVGERGKGSLMHCTFENCRDGVRACTKVLGLNMVDCTFSRNHRYGVFLGMSGEVSILRCKIEGSEMGVEVDGNAKHTCQLTINNCLIAKCGSGIIFLGGKTKAHIIGTCIRNSINSAMCIFPGVVGTVEVNQCSLMDNAREITHVSGPKCSFILNGMLVAPTITQYDLPGSPSLRVHRNFQLAGLLDIRCLNCGTIENLDGEMFSMCGLCKNVVYCSKDCQRAHWKEHKKTCKRIFPRPKGAVEEKKSGEEKDSVHNSDAANPTGGGGGGDVAAQVGTTLATARTGTQFWTRFIVVPICVEHFLFTQRTTSSGV